MSIHDWPKEERHLIVQKMKAHFMQKDKKLPGAYLMGVILILFIFIQSVQAVPLAFFLDWGALPNNPTSYPYVDTYTNVGGSGVDVTLTIPVQGQDEDYRWADPGLTGVPLAYTGDEDVLRYFHLNSDGDVVSMIVNFSQPVAIDEILMGGNRSFTSHGVLEFRAYSGPNGTGSVVLPNQAIYANPATTVNVTSPSPIPGTAPLNIINGNVNYAAEYVPTRQSYVSVGMDLDYHWIVMDYEGVVVQSLVWEEYCSNDSSPQTVRDNISSCDFNSAYLGSNSFDSNLDWGDLPDTFGTTNINGGASHLIDSNLYLGACVDVDGDGQPDAQAGGDDAAGGTTTGMCGAGGDEDGVILATPLIPGEQACVTVTAVNTTGGPATLYGWVDFNGDGDIADAGEGVTFADASVANGGVTDQDYCFTVPVGATFDGGETHMRFRLSTDSGLSSGGFASDGEVEDYYQPLACVGNYVWNDTAGTTTNVQDASDAALSGVDVRLVWAGADDTLDTTANDNTAQGDDALYTVQTDVNGRYNFCGLVPDAANAYRLDVVTPPAAAAQAVLADQGGNDVLDSDGIQAGAGNPVASPPFTIADPINLPTSENGNQDNPGGINNFPDGQDNLTFDFGFTAQQLADWGDLPDSAPGTGAGNYNTVSSDNGPSHMIDGVTYLGACIDGDGDGQPDVQAGADRIGGDDGVGGAAAGMCRLAGDDEDGIVFTTLLVPGGVACANVTASVSGVLNGWIDFNGDGDFSDAGEQIFADEAMSAGLNSAASVNINEPTCFNVPNPAPAVTNDNAVYARFRYTAVSGQGGGTPTGPASSGEVEDYYVTLLDWGDLPDTGAGTGAGNYNTQNSDAGPSHMIGGTYLGSCADTDFDGQPDTEAGVDIVGGDNGNTGGIVTGVCGPLGDEDGVVFTTPFPLGGTACVDVTASTAGAFNGWVDFTGDGDFLDPGEQIFTDQALVSGLNSNICFSVPAASVAITNDQALFARFRYTAASGQGGGTPTGPASTGEVEDYYHPLPSRDWGDLPASFGTLNAGGGPSHLTGPNLFLGTCVDSEADGQPDNEAGMDGTGGDDNNLGVVTGTCTGNDDEDGVTLLTPLIPGGTACVAVTAVNSTGSSASLFGWIDFNGDGDFVGDSNEALTFVDPAVPNGGVTNQNYCFVVPANATFDGGETHMRFRLGSAASLNFGGLANDGEIEDYHQPLACIGNHVWRDTGTIPNVQDAGDAPLNGAAVRLVWAGLDNTLDTAASDSTAQNDDALYTVTTDSNGRYNFCGLIPDAVNSYRADIFTPPPGADLAVTPDQGGSDVLDSDGTQAGAGQPVAGPPFTIPDPISLPTNENGNQDNPGGVNNFPDPQDDLTFDFGFVQQASDWGDLPDSGGGTGASNYNTVSSDSGPSHVVDGVTYLGACVDVDGDGQPDIQAGSDGMGGDDGATGAATGTCNPAGDDEDGIVFATPLVPGGVACVDVTTSVGGVLNGWIDFNGDGDFGDAGEQIFSNQAMNAGLNSAASINISETTCFNVPAVAPAVANHAVYARFRYTAVAGQGGAAPTGFASSGEVEDYYQQLLCLGDLVWNDADDSGTVSGAEMGINGINLNLYLDFDGDGIFEPGVDDGGVVDTAVTSQVGGIDGSYSFCGLTPGGYFVQIPSSEFQAGDILYLFNSSAGGADPDIIPAVDNDDNGVDGGDAAASGIASQAVLNLSVNGEPTANDGNTNDQGNNDANTNMALDLGVTGSQPLDYGDLPPAYANTDLGSNGARHTGNGLILGAQWDADNDGQESGGANGDDADGLDDEDGLTIPSLGDPAWSGATADLAVSVSGDGCLNIWIDFGNGGTGNSLPDGDFNDAGEHVLVNQAVTNATTTVTVNVPAWAFDPTYIGDRNPFLRARLTPRDAGGGCGSAEAYAGSTASPGGLAVGGEVEDYQMGFTPTALHLQNIAVQSNNGRFALLATVILFGLTALFVVRPLRSKTPR